MLVKIRNYRAIERADVVLETITLVAAPNERGKTCIAEAVQAILSATPIVVPGVLKKDAKVLVHDGAESGMVGVWPDSAEDAVAARIIEWPKSVVTFDARSVASDTLRSSVFALGMPHFFDQNQAERATALANYIEAMPTRADVEAAMKDAGYAAPAIQQVWDAVTAKNGWDETYARARLHSTKSKGRWEEVAHESYGSKKAADWKPEHYVDGETHESLELRAASAASLVASVTGLAAVSADHIDRLKASIAVADAAEVPADLYSELSVLRQGLTTKEQQRAAIPEKSGARVAETLDCPSCETKLVVQSLTPLVLDIFSKNKADSAAKKQKADAENAKRSAALDTEIADIRTQIAGLESRYQRASNAHENGNGARKRLAEIGDNKGADQLAIDQAKAAKSKADVELAAFEAKKRADGLHAGIEQNEKLVAILAPDGLRRSKLGAALSQINERLFGLAQIPRWPPVWLDENLNPHYGTRPLWAASKSGKWRARAMMQIALAQVDKSAAVVLDEADILDGRGRNALLSLLAAARVPALICMTINAREKVPNLKAAEVGASYWLENGIAEAL